MPGLKTLIAAIALTATALPAAGASAQSFSFDEAIYLTCEEVHAMAPDARREIALLLAENVASHYGVAWPLPADLSDDAGYLVRGACTMAPNANLFSVIARVIQTTFTTGG